MMPHPPCHAPVPIDSVTFVAFTGGFGGFQEHGYRVTTYFKDLPLEGNYYRLQLSSNDTIAVDKKQVLAAFRQTDQW